MQLYIQKQSLPGNATHVYVLIIKRNRCTSLSIASKLSANLYDIYHCCVYSEKLLTVKRGTVRNMQNFIPKIKNKFEKLVHVVAFIIIIYHDVQSPERQTRVCLYTVTQHSPTTHIYLRILLSDTLRHFNVSLFFGVNIVISHLNNTVKGRPLPKFYILWCCKIAYRWLILSAETCHV